MRKFFDFIVSKVHWLLLILFEVIALTLLFNRSAYHHFLNIGYSNRVMVELLRASGEFKGYIGLREENKRLANRIIEVETAYHALRQSMDYAKANNDSVSGLRLDTLQVHPPIHYKVAKVLSTSVNSNYNLIIIDKGSKDGIRPEMGVLSAHGVAGIVASTRDHYAVVVPLTNINLKLSCKLYHTNFMGTLSWESPQQELLRLNDLSIHATYSPGDTVVTSGYSSIFPPDLYIGRVAFKPKSTDKLSFGGKYVAVEPGTQFATLQWVYVIMDQPTVKPSELDSIKNNYYWQQ